MAEQTHVHPDVLMLADAMDNLSAWLRAHGEAFWADWTAKDAVRIRRGDAFGFRHFAGAFGGMGSLNDVYFAPVNGNAASPAEGARLNREFEAAIHPVRVLMASLWRDAEPPGPRDIPPR